MPPPPPNPCTRTYFYLVFVIGTTLNYLYIKMDVDWEKLMEWGPHKVDNPCSRADIENTYYVSRK